MFRIKVNELNFSFNETKEGIYKHSDGDSLNVLFNEIMENILKGMDLDLEINDQNYKLYNDDLRNIMKILIDNFIYIIKENRIALIMDGILLYLLIKYNYISQNNVHYGIYEFVRVYLPYQLDNEKYIVSKDRKLIIDSLNIREDIYDICYNIEEYVSIDGIVKLYSNDNIFEFEILDNFYDYLNRRGYMKCRKI